MKGAELLAGCLANEGVETIFGLPGEETLALMDALLDSGIRFIPCRHEQGAAFMADVWGRLTGRAGVCLATLGPGATNLMTGIADANLDRAPVVAITGQAGRDRIHKESHQYVNVVDMFRPITKWNTRLEIASIIPEAVRKAFKVAEAEKPGACHLELPEDVAEETVDDGSVPLATIRPRRPSPDRPALRRAAELIDRAKNPLLFAGNGVIRGKASTALREFAGRTGIPVANTFMAKGCLPWDHELALGTIGLQMRDAISCGFDRADLIIAAGYDPVEYAPELWNPDRRKTIVHIDFTPAEVDQDYQPAVEVVADVREALELLRDLVSVRRDPTPARVLHDWILSELLHGATDDGFPLKPQRILHDLRNFFLTMVALAANRRLRRRRPQALGGAAVPGDEPQHGDHLERLCGDGHRAARRHGGQDAAPGTPRGRRHGRRVATDQRAGAGDRGAARSGRGRRDLP